MSCSSLFFQLRRSRWSFTELESRVAAFGQQSDFSMISRLIFYCILALPFVYAWFFRATVVPCLKSADETRSSRASCQLDFLSPVSQRHIVTVIMMSSFAENCSVRRDRTRSSAFWEHRYATNVSFFVAREPTFHWGDGDKNTVTCGSQPMDNFVICPPRQVGNQISEAGGMKKLFWRSQDPMHNA